MRFACLAIAFVTLVFTGCNNSTSKPESRQARSLDPLSSGTSSGTSRRTPATLTPSPELAAAVKKLNGDIRTDNRNPDRPLLEIRLQDGKDNDLLELRPHLQSAADPILLHIGRADGLTDGGIAHLANIDSVRELVIEQCKVTDAGLEPFSGLNKLELLSISDELITDAGLAHLGKLKQLRVLHVYSKQVTDEGLAPLEGLTELEDLHVGGIDYQTGDVRLSHMKGMTKLRELSIGKDKLTDAGMAYVKNFTQLRELRIEGPKVSAEGFASLAPLTKLEKLSLLDCPGINGEGAAALKDMTRLRDLFVVASGNLNLSATTYLGKLTSLKKLQLARVEDAALDGIKGLTALEKLDLSYSRIGDAGLQPLGSLTGLHELDLQNTQVTSAGLRHLSTLKSLADLNLSDDAISDEGLQHLSGLANLENLSLTNAKDVTGAGLKHLAGLTKLQRLRVNGTSVTDEGVEYLKPLRTLILVELTGTRVSDDAALELKKALPKALIDDAAGQSVSLDKEPDRPRVVEDLTKVPAAFSMTAEKFVAEYKENRPAADEKYKGKVIELTGTVRFFSHNSYGPIVSLAAGKDQFGAMCFTADDAPWSKVVPGQDVKMKGKMTPSGFGDQPLLTDCVFVETGPSQSIALTTEALAKEYAADGPATAKKYNEKYLIVSGEIAAKEVNGTGGVTIVMKGDDKVAIRCRIDTAIEELGRPLKKGQKLKIYGKFATSDKETEVNLEGCLPIKGR